MKTATRDEVLAAERGVVLFVDTFNGYFESENAHAAVKVLQAAGYTVHVATKAQDDGKHLCCGRTYLASGMVEQAKEKAREVVQSLLPFAHKGIAIVGLEPSCLLTLRDEMLVMGLGSAPQQIAEHAWLFEEFLAREAKAGRLERLKAQLKAVDQPVLLHGHCHQKAFDAVSPILEVLRWIPGAQPQLIESSCCGMAGSFGYEASHHRGVDADGRTQPAAGGARRARRHRGGRRHQLPPPDRRWRATRGRAREPLAGGSAPRLNVTHLTHRSSGGTPAGFRGVLACR